MRETENQQDSRGGKREEKRDVVKYAYFIWRYQPPPLNFFSSKETFILTWDLIAGKL
jgi:hypothetical protein